MGMVKAVCDSEPFSGSAGMHAIVKVSAKKTVAAMSLMILLMLLAAGGVVQSELDGAAVEDGAAVAVSRLCTNGGIQNLTKFTISEFSYADGNATLTLLPSRNAMVIELCQSLCACGDELVEMGVLPERSYVSTIEV